MVKFLNSIPPALLLQGGSYKGLLRAVAARRLPGLGLERQRKKHAPGVYEAQQQELLSGLQRAWARESTLISLSEMGIIDPALTTRAMALSEQSSAGAMQTMYALLSSERWLAAQLAQRQCA
jgi:hypothetical protein